MASSPDAIVGWKPAPNGAASAPRFVACSVDLEAVGGQPVDDLELERERVAGLRVQHVAERHLVAEWRSGYQLAHSTRPCSAPPRSGSEIAVRCSAPRNT